MKELADTPQSWPVVEATVAFDGHVFDVRRDTLTGDDGAKYDREVAVHPGAVAVVAVDEDDHVLVVRQYRHPVQCRLWEIPAGLLDVEDEEPLDAAKRELAEEGHVRARHWSPLLTLRPSPGFSSEVIHVFLAEAVTSAGVPDGFEAMHEEASMTRDWVPLADIVGAVLAGRLSNGILVAGSLALWAKRRGNSQSTAPESP